MEKVNKTSINRLIYFSLLVFSISLLIFIFKYIGLINLISKILSALIPVFIAIFVSFIIEPFILFFSKRGIKRKYSVLLVYALIILTIVFILYFTIPSLARQINIFISAVPSLIDIVINFFDKIGLTIDSNRFSDSINDILLNISKKIMKYLSSSFSILFNLILGVSGAVFLSFDFNEFKKKVRDFIPKKIKAPVVYYFHNFLPFIYKYFIGMLIDSILIFIISVISFFIIGIDYALVISIIIAITNLIPIIGPYIGGIPAVVVGFSISPTLGISSLLVVVIVQFIESNVIQPLILKNVIKLHPLEGILGISLFGVLFGIVGMILSPILVVAIKLLFIPYDKNREVVEEDV